MNYTKFEIGGVLITSAKVPASCTVHLQLNVANVGKMAGDEVLQIHFRRPGDTTTRPRQSLCGFKRVTVPLSGSTAVNIDIPVKQLRRWDEEKDSSPWLQVNTNSSSAPPPSPSSPSSPTRFSGSPIRDQTMPALACDGLSLNE